METEKAAFWVRPLGEELPAGQNLEYDAEFLALEDAARGKPEQEFSDSEAGKTITIEAQGPDWREVLRLGESLMTRTRDLRVAVALMRAFIHLEGFSGVRAGLSLLLGLLENLWDHVHPQLDPDDDLDPTMRLNALAPLVAFDGVLSDLRAARLFTARQFGVCTVRDVELALGKLSPKPGEVLRTEAEMRGALSEALKADPSLVEDIAAAQALLGRLSVLLQDKVGGALALDVGPLQALFKVLSQAMPQTEAPMGEMLADDGEAVLGAAIAQRGALGGQINSRQDIVELLDRMIAYLERAEPSNPAQLLLARAQRVMNMGFLEAIEELASEGLQQAERSVGRMLARDE